MPRPAVQLHVVNRHHVFRNTLNNNEARHPLIFMRDHLFYSAFVRFALIYSRLISETERKIIEFISLTLSFLSLVILIYIHVVFVRTPTYCLESIHGEWPRNGILRVEILPTQNENYTLEMSYFKERSLKQYEYDEFPYLFHSNPIFNSDNINSDSQNVSNNENPYASTNAFATNESESSVNDLNAVNNESESLQDNVTQSIIPAAEEENIFTMLSGDDCIMEFSLEYGFLKLSPSTRKKLNITVQLVTLDPGTDKCFGSLFNKFILYNFVGYDEVLLASLKLLAAKEGYKGYVRNVVTDVEFMFVSVWMDRKSYVTAGFVMLVFTVSISILLRYSHHQIFVFIVELLHMLEFHSSFSFPAGPLLTVILALVGMEAIMSEFFNDTAIAFYVILIVWMADQYDAICCHTVFSKRHWLRFFYLYHFFFYAYSYRFGHNRFLALLTSWFFMLHSMIYFFHRYELPLLIANINQNQNNNALSEDDPSEDPDSLPPERMDLTNVDQSNNPPVPDVSSSSDPPNETSNDSTYPAGENISPVQNHYIAEQPQNDSCCNNRHAIQILENIHLKNCDPSLMTYCTPLHEIKMKQHVNAKENVLEYYKQVKNGKYEIETCSVEESCFIIVIMLIYVVSKNYTDIYHTLPQTVEYTKILKTLNFRLRSNAANFDNLMVVCNSSAACNVI